MKPKLLRSLLLTLVALATFVASAAVVRTAVPWPQEGALDARIRWIRAHADEIDLVFLGSSNVARSFDPAVVDAELARRGHALRSYNLGLDNMQITETGFVLRELLAQNPARLRIAVIELLEFDPAGMIGQHALSDRVIYWHDGHGLAEAVGRVWRSHRPIRERASQIWLHLQHAAWRLGNLGDGERLLAAARSNPDPRDLAVGEAGGFEALDDREDPAASREHARFLTELPAFEQMRDEIDARNAIPAAIPDALLADVTALAARLRARGIEPIFVIPPVGGPTPSLYALARDPAMPVVLGFNAPSRYPELYATDHRYDATHLNRTGAAAMSLRFAERLAEILDEKHTR